MLRDAEDTELRYRDTKLVSVGTFASINSGSVYITCRTSLIEGKF